MSRPSIGVVMPFAGDAAAAREALAALQRLAVAPGDELIFVDNSGTAPFGAPGVSVVQAPGERSPAHARNVGAEHVTSDWILFLDADCRAPAGLLDAYFAEPVADEVGALAGEVVPAPDQLTLVARYGAARSFLSQEAHLAHPFLPRAVAANLLVRRAAFEQIGGFYEGVRAAEDTDFSWRLQQAGWRLELRRRARVEHRYRATLRELRAQWRGYAAGRAWLRRRYDGFAPQPALRRAAVRALRRGKRVETLPDWDSRPPGGNPNPWAGPLERGRYLALDGLLALDELAGFALSNRPDARRAGGHPNLEGAVEVVLVADRFPVRGDPRVDFARTLDRARVEASGRPDSPWVEVARGLDIAYREDDGVAARALALAWLLARHPLRCGLDLVRRRSGEIGLAALAPAVLRLERQRGARVHPLGGDEVHATARRLAALAGRALSEQRRS